MYNQPKMKVENLLNAYQWNFANVISPPNNPNNLFVFGSNLSGIHGAGAARFAEQQRGAEMYVGEGQTGNCYALPTKDKDINTMPLDEIAKHTQKFIDYANAHPEITFHLTPVGCGLANLTPYQVALMFKDAPKNVVMPGEFFERILQNAVD